MIRLNIKESDLNNADKMLEIANKIMYLRRVNLTGESVDDKLEKCFNYYDGKLPNIEYEKPNGYQVRIANLTKPLVNTATKTFIGDVPDIVTSGTEEDKARISVFNKKLYKANFESAIYETAHYSSKGGFGLLSIFADVGDTFPRFKELNPLFADVVYDCTLACKPLLAYYIVQVNEPDVNQTMAQRVIYIYTKDRVWAFESQVGTIGQPTTPDAELVRIVPYYAWAKGNEQLYSVKHDFGDIPIVEFDNNEELKGDVEDAFDLIAFYNDLLNNRGKMFTMSLTTFYS